MTDPSNPINVESADGVVHQFPSGTDMGVINKVMKEYANNTVMKINGVDTYKGIPRTLANGSLNPDYDAPDNVGNVIQDVEAAAPNSAPAAFGQGFTSGLIKTVGGSVQTLSDILHLGNLGAKIGQITDNASKGVVDPRSSQQNPSSLTAGQFAGQVAPFAAGAGGLGGLDILGGAGKLAALGRFGAGVGAGELADATQEESGKSTGQRNEQRINAMIEGLPFNLALQGAAGAGGVLLRKAANSHAIEAPLKKILDTVESWRPDVSQAATEVSGQIKNLTSQYQSRLGRLNNLVASSGGVDPKGVVPAIKEAKDLLSKVTNTDPSKRVLGNTIQVLDQITQPRGKDFNNISKSLGVDLTAPENQKLVESLEKQGYDIFPQAKANFSTIQQLSSQIESHLDNLGTKATSEASLALKKIQSGLDVSLKNALIKTPAGNQVYGGVKSYIDALKPLQKHAPALLSDDPSVQIDALTDIIENGDERAAKAISPMMGDKGKESFVNLALKQAVGKSYNIATGHINVPAFQRYLSDPGRAAVLKEFTGTKSGYILEGLQNLLVHDAHAKPNAQIFGPKTGTLGTMFGSYGAMKSAVEHTAAGAPGLAIGILGKALIASAALRGTYKMIDGLANTVVGRNFLNASSKLTPETPTYTKFIDQWRPRIDGLLKAMVASQLGTGQQPPQQTQ